MSMTSEKFELMQKWQTVVTLMGFSMEHIYDDWGDDDDNKFYELLEVVQRVQRLTESPTAAMSAVLQTIAMGITLNDIDNYSYELEEREEERQRAEIEALETNNPVIVKLTNEHDFKWIHHSKQYPTHKHYSFTTKDGILVKGRAFQRSWHITRNWLSWKDTNGKSVTQFADIRHGIDIPSAFPKSWGDGWPSTRDLTKLPMIIANHVIHKSVPKDLFKTKFIYPK